jgi:hypothetical protein
MGAELLGTCQMQLESQSDTRTSFISSIIVGAVYTLGCAHELYVGVARV